MEGESGTGVDCAGTDGWTESDGDSGRLIFPTGLLLPSEAARTQKVESEHL